MTTREKAIVSAYSGFLLCDMAEMLKYMSEKLGWEISEKELLARHCDYDFNDDLSEKIRPDFELVCEKMDIREKAIISAWTHCMMCDMADMLAYLSEKLGKTITRMDLKNYMAYSELRQKFDSVVLPDFLALCEGDAESKDKASWWR